jgi:hypothetical protein
MESSTNFVVVIRSLPFAFPFAHPSRSGPLFLYASHTEVYTKILGFGHHLAPPFDGSLLSYGGVTNEEPAESLSVDSRAPFDR